MKQLRIATSLVFAVLASKASAEESAGLPELAHETIERWVGSLSPSEAEDAWLRIPWWPQLWKGVLAARETQRPVLLWAMNGHPLGHT